jgi:dipeptidyl aminopeptidase/acylaminoacyl peptidase
MRWILAIAWGVAAAVSAPAADLSSVETFLGETSFVEVQVAPDGSRVAFVTRGNDFVRDREVFTVWSVDLDRKGVASVPVKLAEMEDCSGLRWSPDGRSLSFLSTVRPDPGPQLVVMTSSPGAGLQPVTKAIDFPQGIDLYDWLPDGSGFVVEATAPPAEAATADERQARSFYGDVRRLPSSPQRASLFLISRADGGARRLGAAPFDEVGALAVSPDGGWLATIGSSIRETADGTEVALQSLTPGGPAGAPRRSRNFVLEDRLAWSGRNLFVSGMGEERDGRYTASESRLYRVDAAAGELHLMRGAPTLAGGVAEVVPLASGSLLTLTNVSTRMPIALVDAATGGVQTLPGRQGWIFNLSASRSGDRIAFAAGDSHHFAEIYVSQGAEGVAPARPVTAFNAALSAPPLPEIETVSWDGGEGVTVEGVLFWPPGRKGERGLPMIVDLHGGPFGAARTEALDLSDPNMSYPVVLAARGFLVLNPNYRGSAGRGDEFARGIEGHHCSRPSEDVIRGVESLIARGFARRGQIGLIGYSGGGGLSKCLIGRSSLFGAAATGAGVWDDLSLFGTERGVFWAEVFYNGKPPWEDSLLWWRESAIGGLGQATTPTLIVAGERDGTAPAQATELYHDLVWRGTPAELLLFPGESHIFAKPSHQRTKLHAEISWLEHYLLGKPRQDSIPVTH